MSAIDRSELDGYEALVSELRATAPVAPDRLRERVLEGAPAPRRHRSRKRRLFLVVVPVAAVLAVGAAVVHGFVSSGSRPGAVPLQAAVAHSVPLLGSGGAAKTQQRKLGPLAKQGSTLNSGFDAAGTPVKKAEFSPYNNAPSAVTIPTHRLVHAVASLQVQVQSRSDLSAKTNEASRIIGSFGGYAQSVRYENSRHGGGDAVLALRVPVQKAQAAIAKLSTLGTLLSQQVSTEDLQAKLTKQTSAIGSLRRAIAVYEQALQNTALPASQRVVIQIKLNNARRALSRLQHARKGTLASGATADISLLLTTHNGAVVGHKHHGSTRIGRLLGSAAHFLALEAIIVLYALIVISPLLLIGGLVWLLLRERRRREERLLSTA
jgi:hypothetical protein